MQDSMIWCLITITAGSNPSRFITGTEWVLLTAELSCPHYKAVIINENLVINGVDNVNLHYQLR